MKSASSDKMTSAFSGRYTVFTIAAEGHLRAFARAVIAGRLPLVPFRLGIQLQQRLNLAAHQWRRNRARQNPQAFAIQHLHGRRGALRRITKRRQ